MNGVDFIIFNCIYCIYCRDFNLNFYFSSLKLESHQFLFYVSQAVIIQSFRKEGVPLSQTVVDPAKKSNHLVGHALDVNLIEKGAWCNSGCLKNPPAKFKGVKCFISRIRGDGALRWGDDFRKRDPVHIDDALNLRNRPLYDRLYLSLQKNC